MTKGELDYYDVADDFIDDGDIEVNNQQACFEIFQEDFNTFTGNITDFVKSDLYSNRVQELNDLDKELGQQEKRERIRDRQQRIEKNKKIRAQKQGKEDANKDNQDEEQQQQGIKSVDSEKVEKGGKVVPRSTMGIEA